MMFTLTVSILTAYSIRKGSTVNNFGAMLLMIIVADLVALNIIFN